MHPVLAGYRGFIFDLDGTLADSMDVWQGIGEAWIRQRKLTPPPDLEERLALMTVTQSANYLISLYGLDLSPEEVVNQWNDMVRDRYLGTVRLKEGAAAFLKRLRGEGFPLGLATSCFPQICRGFLDKHGLSNLFSAVVYTQDTGKDKRSPDVYLDCAEKIGVAPKQCLVFEDILAALQGVRAAGMGFCAVYDDASADDWPALCQHSDHAIESFGELAL